MGPARESREMTLEYVATPHVARPTAPRMRKVEAMSVWLYVLAFVNLAAAGTVLVTSCPAWVLFGIFVVDVATIMGQRRYGRSRP